MKMDISLCGSFLFFFSSIFIFFSIIGRQFEFIRMEQVWEFTSAGIHLCQTKLSKISFVVHAWKYSVRRNEITTIKIQVFLSKNESKSISSFIFFIHFFPRLFVPISSFCSLSLFLDFFLFNPLSSINKTLHEVEHTFAASICHLLSLARSKRVNMTVCVRVRVYVCMWIFACALV